jgi:dihydroflavonol-4-reductase
MTQTVLVTGGTGFIARWCIVELLQRGFGVRTTVRSPTREAAMRDAVSRAVDPNTASPSSYRDEGVSDETVWTDADAPGMPAYRRSKTLAERAAWAFMERAGASTTLTTILPGAVFGPILDTDNLGSVQVIGRLLQGRMRGTPRIGLEVVDVRDIADVHIRAMTTPGAAGQRFLATGEFMWMSDIAAVLRERLGAEARRVPTRTIPDPLVRLVALFDPQLRAIRPGLGRRSRHTTAKTQTLLGWQPRPGADTVEDCARSLIETGVVR